MFVVDSTAKDTISLHSVNFGRNIISLSFDLAGFSVPLAYSFLSVIRIFHGQN